MIYTTEQISKEICRRLGVKVKGSGHQMVSCPKHTDKTPSLSINPSRGMAHCFSCGWGGSLRSMYYNEVGHGIFEDLKIHAADVEEIEYEEPVDFEAVPTITFKFDGRVVPAESHSIGKQFLENRGFDRITAQRYGMRFVISGITYNEDEPSNKTLQINFKNRVIIPIYENGIMISLEGRDVLGEERWKSSLKSAGINPDEHIYKKVLYPKGSSINSLYNFDRLDTNKPLFAVEGLMDLIALRTCNEFKNSTAYFGAQITQRQLHLFDKFKEIIFIPDSDKAGLMTLRKISTTKIWNKTRILKPPVGYKDVNEILQKRGRISSIQDAVDRNWLTKIISSSDFNFDLYDYS
jgi:DNA primase